MDATLEGLCARFEADPGDTVAFEAMEEAHFLAGEWPALVALYERRLESADLAATTRAGARARMVVRLAQVLEERCVDLDAAEARYCEAVELDPGHRQALAQLRQLYAAKERWDRYLAVAQQEMELSMRPFERASFFTEVGKVWLHKLGDPQQAVAQFELALEADAEHAEALLGLADAQAKQGAPDRAALALARAIERLRGTDRAPALVALGDLYATALDQPERAQEAYQRALTDDPENLLALEALADRAGGEKNWDLFQELQERRWEAARDDVRRLTIAHDAGRVHLEERGDAPTARLWFSRALELFPEDPVVHLYLADIERLSGNQEARSDHLKQAAALADDAAPADLLQESAKLATDEGDDDFAVEQLKRALAKSPGDRELSSDLAAALTRLGRDGELIELLTDDAERAEPGSPAQRDAWLRVGTHHEERLGDAVLAREAYQSAFDLDPGSEAAGLALARALTHAGDGDGLLEMYRQVVASESAGTAQRVHACCELGDLAMARTDVPAAQEAFQRATELDADSARAREGLERVSLTLGDDETLIDTFEREAQVTTDRERLGFLVWELARIFEEKEQPERALHWLDHLTQAAPEDVRALQACARLREGLGLREELIRNLERLDPLLHGEAQADNRKQIAELWLALGDRARARDALQAVLEARPDDLEALKELERCLADEGDRDVLVDVRRRLAPRLEGNDRLELLDALARQLRERGEAAAALDAFSEVLAGPSPAADVGPAVEELLTELGHWEQLCARLAVRREAMDPLDPEAFATDVARAELLLDRLDDPAAAIELFDLAREADPASERARQGLERALRRAERHDRLAMLLDEQAETAEDDEQRAKLTLERATLLEDTLEQLPEAKTVLAGIADGDSGLAQEAHDRLLALLERTGDWAALRDRKRDGLGQGSREDDLALHLELADLSLERLEDRTAAIAHLESAAELAPERAATWQRLAALHGRSGDPAGCLRAVEAELATGPELERTVLLRARAAELALDALEDEDRAAAHFAALIELDRGHARAAEFLAGRFETEERHDELVALWQAQVDALQPEDLERGADASLRLRMAALQAGPLDSAEDAIATLEPAAARDVTLPIVAEPLADLYERTGCTGQLLELACRAVDTSEVPEERAGWNLRIGDALRRQGELGRAADAYRRNLVDRPGDRAAQSALRELYRKLDEPEPLVRLLEAQLSEVAGLPEIPIRVELASLLADSLGRGPDALVHLRRVLQLEPEHGAALERGLELARAAERHDDTFELLGLAIARAKDPVSRSALLTRRGELQADVLDRRADALESFRAAAELAPHDPALTRRVRELLGEHGEWAEALAALEREVGQLPETESEARAGLLEEGAALAAEHLSAEAALPWLVRLRAHRADDAGLLEKIAAVHREAGRTEALLRTLEDEIALGPEAPRRAVLEAERARLFEEQLGAPGRATAALEAALEAQPDSLEVLSGLERLYAAADRKRDLAQVLDALIAHSTGSDRLTRHRAAATVWRELGDLETSIDHLWRALPEAAGAMERVEILRELEDLWPRLGRRDLWARVAEAELLVLDPDAPVFAERRRELRWLLADAYRSELARPDLAERHLRALLDGAGEDVERHETIRAEEALLELLRRSGDAVELEDRLTRRLAGAEDSDDAERATRWLELARLRHERLHRIGDAAAAYGEALAASPENVDALRGLRVCAERLGRHPVVADTLEKELELRDDASASERAALYRTLGELSWRELDETTRASRAFAAALEADPADRVSLRSLQSLFETMEDWRGAADLYESEVSVLGDAEPDRRSAAWLRVGAIARDQLEDPTRALAAYDAAAAIGSLELRERWKHAELLHVAGDATRFVEVFASWLDAEGADGQIADHLRLADVLEELGRHEAALARVERALALEPECCEAWDAAARLHDRLGRKQDAAQAHERAAACCHGVDAARQRLAAALRVTSDEERTRLLDRAVADDPACAEAHARLAITAGGLGQVAQAERAALRTTELASASELPQELLLEAALAGGRAARLQEHTVQALGLFDAVLSLQPDHPEALAGHGDVALHLGDAALARPSLERLLGLAEDLPDRATHLTQLGQALKIEGEAAAALERFRSALEIDPRLDEAHRGLAEVYEREERIDEAVDALQTWAARTQEPDIRAGRLMHAARLELDRPDREEPAEALLREAVDSLPEHAEAWTLLCQLLWAQGRVTEALDQSTRAVEALGTGAESATCSLIRGRAMEQRGDHRAAADAFQAATASDPRCSEGALSAARLLRALGEWRESADVLQRFVASAPEDAREHLAPAWHQLGRLLAGPLEDVDGAIEVYHRAFAADPTLVDARHALADLLVHRPERWDEAVALHVELLTADPTRLTSLRGLLRVARGRERREAVQAGLAILRALGCATPEERLEAPSRLPAAAGATAVSDPTGEVLRQLAVEISAEIGEALGVGSSADGPPAGAAGDPIKRLRSALIRTEGELLAPALVPLTNEEVGAVLCLAAELALEVEAVHGDGDLVNALSQALGRRVRRRIRKTLGSVSADDLQSVDWDRWRLELRAHAGLLALDAVDGELRSAFLAWLEATGGEEARDLPPESDLRDRVSADPQARTFLEGLIRYWRQCL